ncbi:hypothetical protein PR202_gb05140 [Eleusine coracana subsp. coracana]|uniref:Wall-associated receptor kinase C-terminal domain-containing protein n=1 Tax=Eleusine coracana subsp. coracana TaxID=191504 RepID=A0AAV5E6B2_ELECO|nr:hypothetical protein PR202_gb05140 [Eleusine coracana subsp. coracana]
MCSYSSRCGSVDIRYPFYLANATKVITAVNKTYSCGYTDLKISCRDDGETETAIIQLGQFTYTVKNISYEASTMILADPDAFRNDGNYGCPIIRHNVTFSREWLSYTGSYDTLAFFFGCYSGDSAPPGFNAYQISCPGFSNSSSGGASFVFSSDQLDATREHDLDKHCDDIVAVPIRRGSLEGMSNRPALQSEYGSLLRDGFELAWSPTTVGGCYRCEESGGRCVYNQNKLFLGCLCSNEKVETQYCSNSSASSTKSRSRSPIETDCFKRTPSFYIFVS